jgi:hypothetical protein
MTTKPIAGRLLLILLCIVALGACSPHTRVRPVSTNAVAAGSATTQEKTPAEDSPVYPYTVWIGAAANRVEREADAARVLIDFVRWSSSNYGAPDAIFQVTNPGPRPVLVWNVRQQVAVPRSDGGANSWQTRESDYPGRGWETATISSGGSVQFPMLSPTEGYWRVCLLYSREAQDSQPPNRRFGGDYESIGPSVHEVNAPE